MNTLLADHEVEESVSGERLSRSSAGTLAPAAHPPSALPIHAFRTEELPEALLMLGAELLDVATGKTSILLAASEPQGSTVECALDLGRALVQLGLNRVVVVQAAAGEVHGLQQKPRAGLVDLLAEKLPLELATMPIVPGLDLIAFSAAETSGAHWPGLAARSLDRLIGTLRVQYDLVLISGPNLRENSLTRLLARKTDGVVLVATKEHQTRSGLARLHQQLRTAQIDILGVILA